MYYIDETLQQILVFPNLPHFNSWLCSFFLGVKKFVFPFTK